MIWAERLYKTLYPLPTAVSIVKRASSFLKVRYIAQIQSEPVSGFFMHHLSNSVVLGPGAVGLWHMHSF